jgi:hypothetical protein
MCISRSRKITFNTCFVVYRIHLRSARSSIYIFLIYIQSVLRIFRYISNLVASRDCVKSLLTRVLPYTEFTFDAPEVIFFLGTFHESSFGKKKTSPIQSRLQYISYIYLIFLRRFHSKTSFSYIPPIYQPVTSTKTALNPQLPTFSFYPLSSRTYLIPQVRTPLQFSLVLYDTCSLFLH